MSRNTAIATGLAKGLNDAVSTYRKIKEAKAKLAQNEELFNLNIKLKEAQLKEAEEKLDPFYIKAEREKIKNSTKTQKLQFQLGRFKLDKAQSDKRREIGNYQEGKKLWEEKMAGELGTENLELTRKVGDVTAKLGDEDNEPSAYGQKQNKAFVDLKDGVADKIDDVDIIDDAMATYGVSEAWAKSEVARIRAGATEPKQPTGIQRAAGSFARGVSNLLPF